MTKELRIGILAIVVTALMIWGYQYVKGKNIFKNIDTFHTVYNYIDQLTVSSPVLINGYKVGSVSDIRLNPENVKSIIVSFQIDGNIRIPKSTRAVLQNAGIVGGKLIALEFDHLCDQDCAKSGDTLDGEERGFLEALVGPDNLSNYSNGLKEGITQVFDTLNARISDENSNAPITVAVRDLQRTVENMAEITGTINALLKSSYRDLDQTIGNMASITANIEENNARISGMLQNVEEITRQLREADMGQTIDKSNQAIDQAASMMTSVESTLENAHSAFTKLNNVLDKMEAGDGSLAQLLNDRELYNNLELTSKNLSLLLQDMRLNPRRYLSVSVFGRKAKKYEKPEDDPAFKDEDQ